MEKPLSDRVTVPQLRQKKREGRKITMLTAYDALFAELLDEAGVDLVLVGDSLALVVQGHETTLPVTLEEMLYHTRLVSRGVRRALVVADMPFLSYQVSVAEAVRNAGRFLQEAGAAAVKLEALGAQTETVRAIADAGIPVMAHLGLTPQAVHRLGGYKVQAREPDQQERLLREAEALQAAGAFALLLEAIPQDLARRITRALDIPTIGIGAGPHCDGQVLVLHDMLGLFGRFTPKFVKRYAHLRDEVLQAVRRYKEDVEQGRFPGEEHSFH